MVADLEEPEAVILASWCDTYGWSRAAFLRALVAAHPDGPPEAVVSLAKRFAAEREGGRRRPRPRMPAP